MNTKNRSLIMLALMLILPVTYSWACPVIVENDTEYSCIVENLESDASQKIVELVPGQNVQLGQKGTHAHLRVKQEYTYDGTSVRKVAELQQTDCSKDNKPITVSVRALFAEQRDPGFPFFNLFDILYEE